ncbi:MAG: hypothetical protein QOF76_3130 [Solirubrobacteraceae bacterium]|jgi:hypothetical protein|nr:hypothetical protein [Solirubrobacteraceae bacterium]
MTERRPTIIGLFAIVAVLAAMATQHSRGAQSSRKPTGITAAQAAAGFTYDASVDAASRQLIESSIAGARPEAQRLIAEIDGLTTLSVADTGEDVLGVTHPVPGGRYSVTLNIGRTFHELGPRGVQRLVLHELGHVVDFALVPDALKQQLDTEIPAGVPCPAGTPLGSCAPRAERFAETFAKWAMFNDIGASLYIGYAVPPVGDFDAWAAPLTALPG